MKPSVASLYQAVEIAQEIPPLLIGERSNTNGSKKFRECLLADDFDGCLRIGLDQEAQGAQVLDLCSAYAGRDETADLTQAGQALRRIGQDSDHDRFNHAGLHRGVSEALSRPLHHQFDQSGRRRQDSRQGLPTGEKVWRSGGRLDHQRRRHGNDRR